jgi:hypothetical protein
MSASTSTAPTDVCGAIHNATTVSIFHISKDILNSSKDILNSNPVLLKLYYCLLSCESVGRDLFLQILCSVHCVRPVTPGPPGCGQQAFSSLIAQI